MKKKSIVFCLILGFLISCKSKKVNYFNEEINLIIEKINEKVNSIEKEDFLVEMRNYHCYGIFEEKCEIKFIKGDSLKITTINRRTLEEEFITDTIIFIQKQKLIEKLKIVQENVPYTGIISGSNWYIEIDSNEYRSKKMSDLNFRGQ